jgi:hypothetical protein
MRVIPIKIRVTLVKIRVTPMKIRVTPVKIRLTPVKIRVTPMKIRVTPMKIRVTPVKMRVTHIKTGVYFIKNSANILKFLSFIESAFIYNRRITFEKIINLMKNLAFILLIVFTACSRDKMSPKEIGERVTKIRKELLERKELPKPMERTGEEVNAPSGIHVVGYNTTRKLEGMADTIRLNIMINVKDTMGRVDFMEMYVKLPNDTPRYRNGEGKTIIYSIDKSGIIDNAYYFMPPTEELKYTYLADGSMMTPSREMINEIDLHPMGRDSVKIPDAKTAEFYNARLSTTLNEIEKFLFNK